MKFSTVNQIEAVRARDYLEQLIAGGKTVEVKRLSAKRSLNQNNYLYLLLSAFGAHFGYTLEEAKLIYKMKVNSSIYLYSKNDIHFIKSSAKLTKDEMTKSIERFRQYSAENDYPLPTATDQGWLDQLSNTIEQNERYL